MARDYFWLNENEENMEKLAVDPEEFSEKFNPKIPSLKNLFRCGGLETHPRPFLLGSEVSWMDFALKTFFSFVTVGL